MYITHFRFKGNLKLKVKLNVNIDSKDLSGCKIKLYNCTSLFRTLSRTPIFFLHIMLSICYKITTLAVEDSITFAETRTFGINSPRGHVSVNAS